jgi:C_GCAxxG_C_C family probable redox protein
MKISLEEALEKVESSMRTGNHCGPTLMKVMAEAYGFDNPDFLWAAMAFRGGLAGIQTGPCGAVSAGAVCLGLRHRCPPGDRERAEREDAAMEKETQEFVNSFREKFGAIDCLTLTGVDLSRPGALEAARGSDLFTRICLGYVKYAVTKLYEIEARRNQS